MKKQRKSGTAHYFFLVYIIKEEKISDAWFGTPAYLSLIHISEPTRPY